VVIAYSLAVAEAVELLGNLEQSQAHMEMLPMHLLFR
jgi:hypothetical protein